MLALVFDQANASQISLNENKTVAKEFVNKMELWGRCQAGWARMGLATAEAETVGPDRTVCKPKVVEHE